MSELIEVHRIGPTVALWYQDRPCLSVEELKCAEVALLVLLSEPVTGEQAMTLNSMGIGTVHFPLIDSALPTDLWSFADFCYELERRLQGGRNLLVVDDQNRFAAHLICNVVMGRFAIPFEEAVESCNTLLGQSSPSATDWLNRHWALLTGVT